MKPNHLDYENPRHKQVRSQKGHRVLIGAAIGFILGMAVSWLIIFTLEQTAPLATLAVGDVLLLLPVVAAVLGAMRGGRTS